MYEFGTDKSVKTNPNRLPVFLKLVSDQQYRYSLQSLKLSLLNKTRY